MTLDDSPYSILVVDDNPTNLSLLFDYLGQLGYHIFTAESGESALKRMEFLQPDLILLDIMMPGMDGFEVIRLIRQKPGCERTPIIFMTALDDVENKVRGFASGAVDYITKPIQHEEVRVRIENHLRLARLREELRHEVEEKDKALGELDAFSHTVAHEIKTPLNSLVSFSDLLVSTHEQMPVDERQRMLEMILSSSRRMHGLVDDLLLLSRVRTEAMKIETVDMRGCLNRVLQRLNGQVSQTQADIKIVDNLPPVLGVSQWVERVWENLLTNALKYGGEPPRIRITSRRRQALIEFCVCDNGPGIAREDEHRLFAPFVRLAQDRVPGRKHEGHGLGLSIVRRIVGRLEGRVGSRRNPEGGACFFFLLPKAPL